MEAIRREGGSGKREGDGIQPQPSMHHSKSHLAGRLSAYVSERTKYASGCRTDLRVKTCTSLSFYPLQLGSGELRVPGVGFSERNTCL